MTTPEQAARNLIIACANYLEEPPLDKGGYVIPLSKAKDGASTRGLPTSYARQRRSWKLCEVLTVPL
jgi:hypothetical protein